MELKKRPPAPLRVLYAVEDGLLVTILLVMILLAFSQIVLRNFANTGFVWGDALLRHLVLWIGMIGAMVATREDNHINIDILSVLVSPRKKVFVRIFTDAFTAFVCGVLTIASVRFLLEEADMGTIAFGNVPTWVAELILPIAFGVICLRYCVYLVQHTVQAIQGVVPTPDDQQEKA